MLRLALRPDNIDSWAKLLNPQNLSYFFPDSFSLSSSIPLFLLPLQPFSVAGVRGIPEGDFPCFLGLSTAKDVHGIQANTCYRV